MLRYRLLFTTELYTTIEFVWDTLVLGTIVGLYASTQLCNFIAAIRRVETQVTRRSNTETNWSEIFHVVSHSYSTQKVYISASRLASFGSKAPPTPLDITYKTSKYSSESGHWNTVNCDWAPHQILLAVLMPGTILECKYCLHFNTTSSRKRYIYEYLGTQVISRYKCSFHQDPITLLSRGSPARPRDSCWGRLITCFKALILLEKHHRS